MTATTCYLLFLAFSLIATTLATLTLHRATVALPQTSAEIEPLVRASGRLIVLAFALTNLGWIAYLLLPRFPLNTPDQLLQFATDKCGLVLLSLGLTAFVSIFALTRVRRLLPSSPAELA